MLWENGFLFDSTLLETGASESVSKSFGERAWPCELVGERVGGRGGHRTVLRLPLCSAAAGCAIWRLPYLMSVVQSGRLL